MHFVPEEGRKARMQGSTDHRGGHRNTRKNRFIAGILVRGVLEKLADSGLKESGGRFLQHPSFIIFL